jgi:iron complex outermembrane receptor protein
VRGSVGTGFRAPSLIELFQPFQFGATGNQYDDPRRCASTGSPRDCNTQFTTRGGGNPELKPERSDQWSIGAIVEPVTGISAGLDYWNIKIKDVIGQPSEEMIFGDILASEASGLIVRYAPGSAGCQGNPANLPCPISYGIQGNLNLIKLEVAGYDVTLNYRSPRMNWGALDFKFTGTYYDKWDQQSEGGDVEHLAGRFAGDAAATVITQGASGGAVPRWRHKGSLQYNYGPWQGTLAQTFQNGYLDQGDTRRVGSYSLWDLSGGYTGIKNLTVQLGVKNLFDRDPPFTRQGSTFQVGYDPTYGDPRGRFWWGSLKYAFK